MSEYLLYGFAQSGNCYKAALYLELAGADWRARFVDYFNGETRTAEYRRINVMGEAPVLEHGDLRLSQSAVILDYLVERFGRYGWNDGAERREILRWLFWDNHKLTSYTATYRFLRTFAPETDKAVLEEFRPRPACEIPRAPPCPFPGRTCAGTDKWRCSSSACDCPRTASAGSRAARRRRSSRSGRSARLGSPE